MKAYKAIVIVLAIMMLMSVVGSDVMAGINHPKMIESNEQFDEADHPRPDVIEREHQRQSSIEPPDEQFGEVDQPQPDYIEHEHQRQSSIEPLKIDLDLGGFKGTYSSVEMLSIDMPTIRQRSIEIHPYFKYPHVLLHVRMSRKVLSP